MEQTIAQFFKEATEKHCNLETYKKLLFSGEELLDYAVKNDKLSDFKTLITPQKYDDGVMRILYDPFSDYLFLRLNFYLQQETSGIKELIDSLYEIDKENLFQIKIKDSRARQISGMGHPIIGTKDIIYYSEPACLESMFKLYELNIPTWGNDTEGCIEDGYVSENERKSFCGINIYYSKLSEENKQIITKLQEKGFVDFGFNNEDIAFLKVECQKEETIGEVSNRLLALVSQLKIQDVMHYQLTEEVIRSLVADIYKVTHLAFRRKVPYDILSQQLIKYYDTFDVEDFPEKEEVIDEIKCNKYSEEDLNEYFHQNEEFSTQVIKYLAAITPIDECVDKLLRNGYYIDEGNEQIFNNKIDCLKHQNYLKNQSRDINASSKQEGSEKSNK